MLCPVLGVNLFVNIVNIDVLINNLLIFLTIKIENLLDLFEHKNLSLALLSPNWATQSLPGHVPYNSGSFSLTVNLFK